jgi:hypothetical protein
VIVELNTPLKLPMGVGGATGSAEWHRKENREVALVTTGAAKDPLMLAGAYASPEAYEDRCRVAGRERLELAFAELSMSGQ